MDRQGPLLRRYVALLPQKLVVLVGSPKAIGQAVRVTSAGRWHTALAHRLAWD